MKVAGYVIKAATPGHSFVCPASRDPPYFTLPSYLGQVDAVQAMIHSMPICLSAFAYLNYYLLSPPSHRRSELPLYLNHCAYIMGRRERT
jgi:hypothetical protein